MHFNEINKVKSKEIKTNNLINIMGFRMYTQKINRNPN